MHVLKICSFQKGHPNHKGWCLDTLDSPWIRLCEDDERRQLNVVFTVLIPLM